MKILIIKLGAKGDVVRTLCILPALKEKYPDSDISWITKENTAGFLQDNPYIKKILTPNEEINQKPLVFDILINFDIDEEACQMAEKISAEKKLGFYMKDNFPAAFNLGAEYYLNTLFDDELKKSNKKTYQEMMFQAAELEWKKQKSEIFLNKKDKKYAQDFLRNNMIKGKIIGIHLGASPRWPSKAWHPSQVKEFIIKSRKKEYNILLFGGPDEINRYSKFAEELGNEGIKIFLNNPQNSNKEFSSLVNICDMMICSDSLALHVALALNKPVIGLFFCTSPDEIEDYNLLKKLVSPMLKEFFPEKSDLYDENLVKSISASQVFNEAEKILNKNK
ncbi:glycosyltransferase family 9 protein [Candidatus Pacearchaeota archaeon]|nr:glycosyltransferase family 9 protein [Candidatus Pacearchaeota archaeon]